MVNYICECCNYETKLKSNYERHLKTIKHTSKLNNDNNSIQINNNPKIIPKSSQNHPKIIPKSSQK